tara:strand:- start:129 stop:392 length:264 start_codon:yes stop_codon:yes gene_type:complete
LTTDERIQRGERARMLMQDPLLSEVMDSIEKRYMEELLRVSSWRPFSDAKRRALIDRVNAVRELRSALESEMALGRQAADVQTYRVA